jgi:RNA polymerase sigma-70 factor (ECF subfamily)
LIGIAANAAVDFLRRRKPSVSMQDVPVDTHAPDDVQRCAEENDTLGRLKNSTEALPPKYCKTVTDFAYRGMSVKEIAEAEKEPPKTVETRLYRARRLIRERWGKRES